MGAKSKDSTENDKGRQAKKPYAGFPLFVHQTGRWCKKVRQKLVYFGKVSDDPDGQKALELWKSQMDELLAGKTPSKPSDKLTVEQLAFKWLDSKAKLVGSGDLSPRTLENYRQTAAKVALHLGRTQPVTSLRAEDFDALRAALAKGVGPVTLRNDVRMARMMFRFAEQTHLVGKPVQFGTEFKIPAKRTLRKHRRQSGKRMFEAVELRAMIDAAPQPLRAMILLAINTGCGNTDCANLQFSDIDLKAGWLDYPRAKTEVDRRAPLWPETVTAMAEAIEKRPKPLATVDDDCVFLTKYRQRFVRIGPTGGPLDSVGSEFGKLMKSPQCPNCGTITRVPRGVTAERCRKCRWKPEGDADWQYLRVRGFYALRHTFQTIAEESKDMPAVRYIMGHSDPTMSAEYRETISDQRLRDVVDVVRVWLWPDTTPKRKRGAK